MGACDRGPDLSPEESAVWETVLKINRCWTTGDLEPLKELFHPEMVAFTPMDRFLLEGRDACYGSWERFSTQARTIRFEEHGPRIRIFDRVALVTYYYRMTCEAAGQVRELAGRDMLVLLREGGRWRALADQFSPFPAEDGGIA